MWKERQSDTPIRTIKTVIHALVRLLGEPILSQLGRIDNLKESELETYLHKLLKSGVGKDKDATIKGPSDQLSGAPEKKDGSTKLRRLSKSSQETLTVIFRKIGSKEQSQEVVVIVLYIYTYIWGLINCFICRDWLSCTISNSAIRMLTLSLS